MNAPDTYSPVVVGTIAFGMGLDKRNIRRVFHFNLPRSPEDLAQQARSHSVSLSDEETGWQRGRYL